ncbi:MAG: flagellar biosynthetic protein FliO [Treponema sp.]|jgi:flagellar protein FliO/FliZ|nr:flagellar biosynthetic protein FliO [Treponema sp.]
MVVIMGCWGVPYSHADEPAGDESGSVKSGGVDASADAGENTLLSAPIGSSGEKISAEAGENPLLFEAEDAIILGEPLPGPAPPAGPSVSVVLRMVLVLALAAAAIYGVVFFLRRAARPRESNNPHLKILTSAHLGSNRFIYIVAVGSRAWLLGAGEGGVSLIAEVTDQETVDAMLLESSVRGAETAGNFRALLRRLGGGFVPDKPGPSGEAADTLRRNRERLRGL